MKIVGYADTWSVEPGSTIRFMVSSESERYRADVVRLIHGDINPAGPGLKSESFESSVSGEYAGRVQPIRTGSHIRIPYDPRLDLRESFRIEAWIFPTTPDKNHQTLISKRDNFELCLVKGRLEFRVGQEVVQVTQPVAHHTWYFVSAGLDVEGGEIQLTIEPLEPTVELSAVTATVPFSGRVSAEAGSDILIAASEGDEGPINFFNGKIEAPLIKRGADAIASWDFSVDISSRHIRDASGNGLDGRTVNMPMRATVGHNWDGAELAWRHAPQQYGAIHFHDDDLDDAGWEVDFTWTVPDETRSGVYSVHLQAGDEDDYIPFFVRPKRGRPTAKILFLAPLFSYMAYSNDQIFAKPHVKEAYRRQHPDAQIGALVRDFPTTAADRYMVDNRLLSLYDHHSDGSGVCYSSRLRPLLNMRPTSLMPYLNLGEGAPHQFSADLHLVDWLYENGYEFDVATDEDLHREGAELLQSYNVVLTGTHAEYWSEQMLNATTTYLDAGGRLMYLSGNGLWWVTQLDPEQGHTIEIRRGAPVTGPWNGAPGEGHLSTTGEPGGTWRYRGRAPQRIVGVGTSAIGSGPGRPYERLPGSYDPRATFIFEGIADDELIGDFPCLINGYGAANFEFDRLDYDLGSARHSILLANATGFSENYGPVFEDTFASDA